MSEEKKKRARIELSKCFYQSEGQTITFEGIIRGTLESEKNGWNLGDYETKVTGTKVKLNEFVGLCLLRYFNVRQIQTPCKKASMREAKEMLAKGFDWHASHVNVAKKASPAELVERGLAQMSPAERAEYIAKLIEEQARLDSQEPKQEPEDTENEMDETE